MWTYTINPKTQDLICVIVGEQSKQYSLNCARAAHVLAEAQNSEVMQIKGGNLSTFVLKHISNRQLHNAASA